MEDDPYPVKYRNAFLLFHLDTLHHIKPAVDSSMQETCKLTGKMWNELTEAAKNEYRERAEVEKKAWKAAVKAWNKRQKARKLLQQYHAGGIAAQPSL